MNERDDTVGYKKPPKWTRFTKGTSGNPKGRPKKSLNTATIVKSILDEEVAIKRNGETIGRMCRRLGILTVMANKAMAGDVRAAKFFFPDVHETQSSTAELLALNARLDAERLEHERTVRAMTPAERSQFRQIVGDAKARANARATANRESAPEQ